MTLLEKITQYMEVHNIKTKTDFANFVGLPYTTINNLFVNRSGNTKRDTLIALKNAMNITLDELVDDSVEVNFENDQNKKYINGEIDVFDNTVIAIGRGGKRVIYNLNETDARLVDAFLDRLSQKSR